MDAGAIFFITLGVLTLIIGGIIFSSYNGIIECKNQIKRNWADVLTWERLKIKLIPQLVEHLKTYQGFEKETLEKITGLRSSINALLKSDNASAEELKEAQQKAAELKSVFTVTAEAYPQLKTVDLYSKLMKEITEAEQNIGAAIRIFNAGVQEFNNAIQTFPGSWVNSKFNKQQVMTEFTDSGAQTNIEHVPNFG